MQSIKIFNTAHRYQCCMVLLSREIVPAAPDFHFSPKKEEIQFVLDILTYLWNNYDKDNRSDHFSISRVIMMLFLVDWYYAQRNKDNWKQATTIPWYYDLYGPYVDLVPIVRQKFKIILVDDSITLFELREEEVDTSDSLDKNIKEIINMVIKNTQNLSYFDFINYVNRIPAIKHSRKGKHIQISQIARKFFEGYDEYRYSQDVNQ